MNVATTKRLVYEPDQPGLYFPKPPVFASAAERACEIQPKAEAAGSPLELIPRKAALHSRNHVATPFMAWLHRQPIFDAICGSDANLFD